MKRINEKSIYYFTTIIYIITIFLYEVFYCNFQYMKGNSEVYNISAFRIIFYIFLYIIYFLLKNKFTKQIVESFNNKFKKIITIISIIVSIILIFIILTDIIKTQNFELKHVIFLILISLINIFLIYVTNDIIKNTIVMSLTLGIIFSITITINNQLDEKKHFLSSYSLALGNLSSSNHTVDISIANIGRGLSVEKFNHYFNKYPERTYTKEYKVEDECDMPAGYYPISYIFSAMGIYLAKNLGGSIADIYFAGRIFNLFGYCLLMCIAFKILPYKKKIFFIIAFMPMLLCLSSIYSIDGISFGLISIFIAYCLKLYENQDKINIKQILILILTLILMGISKGTGYIFMSIFALILPIKKIIKENKKYIWYIITALAIILIILLAKTYAEQIHDYGDTRNLGSNSQKQLEYILENPIEYTKILFAHTKVTLTNINYLHFLNAPMFFRQTYDIVCIALLFYILIIGLLDESKSLKARIRIVSFITFFAVFIVTSTALYISYTPVGENYIAGYQLRYIFPIIPLILMSISNEKVRFNKENKSNTLIISYISSYFIVISLIDVIFHLI